MAFRALLFAKSEETNAVLISVCKTAGIQLEVCSDIFSAIEKGTKQSFSAILADWSNQPESGFLLKRARESSPNKGLVAIAIVDHEPAAAEMRDHNLGLLIYRPIEASEAQDVLAKAAEKMQHVSLEDETGASAAPYIDAGANAAAVALPDPSQDAYQPNEEATSGLTYVEPESDFDSTTEAEEEALAARPYALPFRKAVAVVAGLAAVICLWNARDTIVYLAETREGRFKVLEEAVASLFYVTPSGAVPVSPAVSDSQQDAYFTRRTPVPDAQSPGIGVVAPQAELAESSTRVPKPADFPLPAPVYEPVAPPPVHVERGAVPDSLRTSAPITRPVVLAPAQMTPVSMPNVPSMSTQQFSEPVPLSEEAARALLVKSVNPAYPSEAKAQKLRGPVVLQATIGRDGNIEDLKILRGSFVLAKAAIAAVKQWRFQPYTLNGHAAQTQTTLTINFSVPAS